MKRLAVFVSGSGSDLQSIIDGTENGRIDGKVVLVVASKPDIYALQRAEKHGIESVVFDKAKYDNIDAMYDALIEELKSREVDLIVLAGYLTILTQNIIAEYRDRIINIHPSLIPAYCGMGYYGLRVHKAVIENREKLSGCTVHFVDEGADTGKIIAQRTVPVFESDTAETLQKRVLEAEHILLPEVVAELCKK